jgi:DNA polymerase I-like protein with 3'-5' exonuclease and polymerase domains/uracil-DNA glycosylase
MPTPTNNKVEKEKFFRDILKHKGEGDLKPGADSPICKKCGLYAACGSRNPFLEFRGSTNPLITFVFELVSAKDDDEGKLGAYGTAGQIKAIAGKMWKGFDMSRARFVAVTRCASRTGKRPNFAINANWCRYFVVDDLIRHTPQMIVPVGTIALGALSYKSNANDWAGKVLTYRGLPDDWLTNPKFTPEHPVFGKPELRIPIVPIQHPRIVYMQQSERAVKAWHNQISSVYKNFKQGTGAKSYQRPWYDLSTDPDHIEQKLKWLIENPGTLVSYDTETTGLKPFVPGAAVVTMMFRWQEDGQPVAIGFPWNYPESPIKPHIGRLLPTVLKALYSSKIMGHNLTFDVLWTYATVPGASLHQLADAMGMDTWHALYTLRQSGGSLSLDRVAYDYVPELSGYEEDLSLMIELHGDKMNPANGKGGHYANCPPEHWDTKFKSYIMGDVEVPYLMHDKINDQLAGTRGYRIPIANPRKLGSFKMYLTPSRGFVYNSILQPSSQVLAKMMGRGMHVSTRNLQRMEDDFPKLIRDARKDLREVDERVVLWCEQQEATVPGWELDLESKDQLKEILFNQLNLPIKRLTPGGKKLYGDKEDKLQSLPKDKILPYAAVDKFTLNSLAVEHPQVRPLQSYRKIHKLYTTYIRPLRNIFTQGIDKKKRVSEALLEPDGKVHGQFMLTGTRGGRLSSRAPNLQNMPKDGDVKMIYTSRFEDAGCMYGADMSQIELRLMAALCGDPSMVKAYRENLDLHSLTTSKIYGIPYEHFSKEYTQWLQDNGHEEKIKELSMKRRVGKTTNFLTGYGGGALGLQSVLANSQVYLSIKQCEDIIESFFGAYPSLRQFLAYYKRFIMDNACAVSMFGRVRQFDEVFSSDMKMQSKALRAGCNHVIQSTASDMMLVCLCAVENCMRAENLESILVSTVHDSLLIDARKDELDKVHDICTGIMEHLPETLDIFFGGQVDLGWMQILPFGGDYVVGNSYYQEIKITDERPDWDRILAA